jgi:hypothetical protein
MSGDTPFEDSFRRLTVASRPQTRRGQSAAGVLGRALPPFARMLQLRLLQRPKFIAPISPNDASPPSRPTGMLMLGFRLNRELNTNPVPRLSRP